MKNVVHVGRPSTRMLQIIPHLSPYFEGETQRKNYKPVIGGSSIAPWPCQ